MKLFELYIEKLNPACDALFQRPRDNYDINVDIWYQNRPMGKNTLGSLILSISKDTGLSKIRVITKLPNSEQSYKGKVKTHYYINRQNQSTTGKL